MPKAKHLLATAVAAAALIGGGVYYQANHSSAPAAETVSPAEAAYREGIAAAKRKDYAAAFRLLSQAAEQGHAAAQNELGALYHFGLGVKQDYTKAMDWYQKSAAQGYANAQNNIGEL